MKTTEKIKIPKYVAEWYTDNIHKVNLSGFDGVGRAIYITSRYGYGYGLSFNLDDTDFACPEGVRWWISENKLKMIEALLNGYEIEEQNVIWQEAFEAWVNGADIKCVIDGETYKQTSENFGKCVNVSGNFHGEVYGYRDTGFPKKCFTEGKWYIL